MKRSALVVAVLFVCFGSISAEAAGKGWVQSYKAGYTDKNGNYCGGSEIMHIVAHRDKLYAFNGFWKDKNLNKYSAQVLRLDKPDGQWVAELTTNQAGLGYKPGKIRHMKGNILKSVTFKTDKTGKRINETVLVGAAWAWDVDQKHNHGISIFVKDDAAGKWNHTVIAPGPVWVKPPDGSKGRRVRRVCRDIEVYHDPITKVDRIFLLGGGLGMFSGVYNSKTKTIEWSEKPEFPKDGKPLITRPLGISEANGSLFFSVGGQLWKRKNGKNPDWELVFEMKERINPELGGFRGLTTIKNPVGAGESLIYVWIPRGRARGDIKRIDGVDMKPAHETKLRKYFNEYFKDDKIVSRGILGGYNRFLPVKDPKSGKTVHIVGFQQTVDAPDASVKHGHYYKGGTYCVRWSHDKYTMHCINGKWSEGKSVLVAPRAYAESPFPSEKGTIYFGGFDSNFREATDRAWIFKGDIETVLRGK